MALNGWFQNAKLPMSLGTQHVFTTEPRDLAMLEKFKQSRGFVCEKQYQFVAAVNRRFKDTYLEIFLP